MTREPTYLESLRRLRLSVLRPYLESRGWERAPDYKGALAVFRKGSDSAQQFLVPIHPEFDDFDEQMSTLISRIAQAEGRSERAVLQDIYATQVDTLRYSVISSRASAGNLPLEHGMSLLEGARRSLLAAACRAQAMRFLARVDVLRGSEIDIQGRRYGEVTLSVILGDDDEIVRARAMLDAQQYAIANEAHMQNRYLVVTGILDRSNRLSTVRDVTGLELTAEQLLTFPAQPTS